MILEEICALAASVGKTIDLSGCDYGPHKRTGQFLGLQPYYAFLAGLVRSLRLRKVLEIGTSFGGSMLAIHRGCLADNSAVELVTVDKIEIAGDALKRVARIHRIIGDSLAPATVEDVSAHLSRPIDLLYIDSKHSYDHTERNLAIYGTFFSPRFVILDDIRLNEEMKNFWSDQQKAFREHAFDASELAERPTGFGILHYAAANQGALADPGVAGKAVV